MSKGKREFFLCRDDLLESKKSTPTNEVTKWDFKTSAITFRQIINADLIVFCESLYDGKGTHGNSQRVLKDRHNTYFKRLTFNTLIYEQRK